MTFNPKPKSDYSYTRKPRTTAGMDMPQEGTEEYYKELRRRYPSNRGGNNAKLTSAGKFALTWKAMYDKTDRQVCERFGFDQTAWAKRKNSPEGKLWQKHLDDMQPGEIVKMLWRGELLGVTIEYPLLYELAKESGDFKTALKALDKMVSFSEVYDAVHENRGEVPQIIINIPPGAVLAPPKIETEYIEGDIVEEDD